MKVGLLADIHANSDALSAVVSELNRLGVSTVIVAGDSVGYYYNILEVRQLLVEFKVFEILGNHEELLLTLDSEDFKTYEANYGSGLRRNSSDLAKIKNSYINQLKHPLFLTIENCRILVSHGAPWSIDEYLHPNSDEKVWERFKKYDAEFFILGHTHHQMIKRLGSKLIVNPGSVGQSRNYLATADWATLDLSDNAVTFYSTRYETTNLLKQCQEFDPNLRVLTKHLRPAAYD